VLVVTAANKVVFLDVERMNDDSADPVLGSLPAMGARNFNLSVYANVTSDDRLLFISEEASQSITVIDLKRARSSGFGDDAIIGDIPTGESPIALTFSPDGKWLYTTSEVAPSAWKWPNACTREGSASSEIVRPEGAVVVIDVARAGTDPANAVVARVPSGCSPVRAAISPEGQRLFVTARNSDAVLAFGTTKLVSDPEHALLGKMPVGAAPVPIAVVDEGKKVIAGNSNRFANSESPQSLTVLDASKLADGSGSVLGTIPAGAFPREMRLSADGHTLFLTNASSSSLQVMDVARLADILQPLH
jgi:DNA-binding beta-propeller fold protein YncE